MRKKVKKLQSYFFFGKSLSHSLFLDKIEKNGGCHDAIREF
ncbi:hypothetical protein HMPREF3219_0201484 [Streptococcus salivarius]|nr:hypothetical protein HMPREF3219_0201484 [Streptococcus salivarius]